MTPAERTARLREAVTAQGLVPGEARRRPGRSAVTLLCLRPEPVTLRADASGALLLDAWLPYVVPGGRLHRRIKAWLAERRPDALCVSRNGALSLGLPGDNWAATLGELLALAGELRGMLDVEWPDYARGVFAAPLVLGG